MWNSEISYDICSGDRNSQEDLFDNKENMMNELKNHDLSFYETDSPTSPSRYVNSNYFVDTDPNSQDSGYGLTFSSEMERFSSLSRSPQMSFESLSLSLEDDVLDDLSLAETPAETLPQTVKTLITGTLASSNDQRKEKQATPSPDFLHHQPYRPKICRALSLYNEDTTPNSSKSSKSGSFSNNFEIKSFKRQEHPNESFESPFLVKRTKLHGEGLPKRPAFQRAFSATDESIKFALQRSTSEAGLIGDFSKPFSLPLTEGRHQELKSWITADTLAKLIMGQYNSTVSSFKVIDCRYPYEYEGGHIQDAINIYTKEQCLQLLEDYNAHLENHHERHILIFHCEFSSERGPNLFRYLRQEDRNKHKNSYPTLLYPEVYILEGGYKSFFNQFADLCTPSSYKEMLHPEHGEDLRFFRQKSKTWNSDTRQKARGFKRP